MAFNTVTANSGSGGANFAMDTFTDTDSTARTMPYCAIAFGAIDGPYTVVNAGAGLPISDAGGSLTVDAPVGTPVFVRLSDGSAAISTLPVSIASTVTISGAVTNAGTFVIQENGAALTSLQLLDDAVYAEDAASASGDKGFLTLVKRTDTPGASSGADGDYEPLQSAGGRLWVDASGKTLTVGSHDVTNAGTFAVQAAQSGTWNVVNVSGTVSLPTGAATAAKQPALGIAGTASSDVITVQGIASMTALKVDGSAVTQPVSGTVSVTNSSLTTIASAVYAEDVASANSDPGVMVLARRTASPANTSGTDADYESLQINAGRLWASATIDAALPAGSNAIGKLAANSGVDIGDVDILSIAAGDNNIGNVDVVTMPNVTLAAGTNTNEVVGDVAQDSAVAGNPLLIGGRASSASPTDMSADGDAVYLWTTLKGALNVADAGGSITVDNGGAFAVQVDGSALTRLTDIETNTDSGSVVGNGAAATSQRVTVANDSTGILAGVTTVTTLTGGGVAHDMADSGNPHKVGARATNAEITAVANNDRTDLVATLTGKLITHPWSNPENFVSGAITTAMTGTTSTSLIAAPAAGLRNYITHIVVSNSHATVGTDVVIQDGSSGTTLYTIPAAAVYGGASIAFPVPLRQPTTATAIYCANVTTGASTKVSASGYKAA